MTVGPCWAPWRLQGLRARAGGRVEARRTSPSRSSRPELAVLVGRSALASRPCSASSPVRSARRGAPCCGRDGGGNLGARGLARCAGTSGRRPGGHLLRTGRRSATDLRPAALGTGWAEARERALAPGRGRARPGAERAPTSSPSVNAAVLLAAPGDPAAALARRRAHGDARRAGVRDGGDAPAGLPSEGPCLIATQSIELTRALDGRVLQLAAGRLGQAILSSYLLGATLRGCRRGGAPPRPRCCSPRLPSRDGRHAGRRLRARLSGPRGAQTSGWSSCSGCGPRPEAPDGVVGVPGPAGLRTVRRARRGVGRAPQLLGPRGDGLDHLPSNRCPPGSSHPGDDDGRR
jgi:hypothetical protein